MQDSRGGKTNIQWLIRTENEKQIGPYSTEAVLKLISEGALTGGEKIKRYPDGKWTAISKQTDFYDKLLEALEEVPRVSFKASEEKQEKIEANTVLTSVPAANSKPTIDESEKTQIVSKIEPTQKKPLIEEAVNPNQINLQTIDLVPVEKAVNQDRFRTAKLPLFLAAGAAILGMLAYLLPSSDQRGGKPQLLIPRAGTTATMSAEDVKMGLNKAVNEFTKDTFEGHMDAQNKLVSVIEGAPQNIEARGTLCLVYRELWPFVKQDARDLEAIYSMAKATRSQDPTGINGVYCEIVKLMTIGKYKEARGVVEYALNQPQMSTAPVLYQLKAELLFEDRDIRTAILYMDKAKQLWPEWVKPHYEHAKYLARADQATEAAQAFQLALQKNPKHKLAQIDYGILLYKSYRRREDALKTISSALGSVGKISRIDASRAHFFLGLIFSEMKDVEKARENAQFAFELNPGDLQIKELVTKLGGSTRIGKSASENNELVFLGDQHQRTGNFLAAQAEYKAAFELDPTNAMAALKAAKCLWQMNQGNEATQWLKKAIKADSKLSSAYVLLADYQSERFDYLGAMQILNKASQLFPNNYEVLRGYGMVEFRRNNVKDAISYLQRANKLYENDIDTLILLAKAHTLAGDYNSAQKFSVRAIELDATNTEAQIVYARILTQFQGLETGVLYLKDLITKFSYTIDFRLALANLYKEQERSPQAQKIFEQLVDADPRNKKARLGLGESYQAQAFFDKALKQFLAASVLDPTDAEGLFRAGLLYMEIGKNAEAITQLKRAQAINPLFPRLNYYIGKAFFQNSQYDDALVSAQEERKLNPNLADSYILAAEIYSATRQFQKCATEYQQAVKLRSQGAELYVKMARCYRQGGNSEIAESMLNIAASQESGLPEIYKEQGAVYETKGDMRAAVQAYNKYLALSPNAPDRREIENLILSIGNR